MKRGVPRREVLWAPGTKAELKGYSKQVRSVIGRGIEVAQWGQTDTHVKRMKGKLGEVYEIVAPGDKVTHRACYYPTKDPDGPIAVLDVFIKKSTSGISTPPAIINRIVDRLKRVKAIEKEK
jgi:phage-related protein